MPYNYKLRKTQTQASLSFPQEWAELIPDDMRFDVQLTPQGILYVPHSLLSEADLPAAPAWAKTEGADRA